jgi:NAD(P)-dependent dehydrogenase (short-subunit alcohol dehydrogenase family)
MSKVIAIVGFGPGTATAVADRFGAEGFSLALVARNEERVAAGVSALKARGITAFGFQADAADPASIRTVIGSIRSQMGPITVLHWNAYGGLDVGDLLTADPAALRGVFDVAVFGLIAAVNESLADLKKSDNGAVLVSNGGFGAISPVMDEMAANQHFMGIAIACAAKDKLVGLLAPRLEGDGIYVGEVTTYGTIKGTTPGVEGTIDPTRIAGEFWRLYQSRSETRAAVR